MADDDGERLHRAKNEIRALLDSELALVKAEVIARLGEQFHARDPRNIDSHVTGIALNELRLTGELIVERGTPSKGGHRVDTYQPATQKGRRTAVAAAARRKRALYARYLSWAGSSVRYPNGLLGPAGETATRTAILASAALQPATPQAGPVARILGVRLPGEADSGGFMNPIIQGIPQPPVTLLFEVKNIRDWIYPSNSELFQVLRKGIVLQQANPTVPVVPILVCRKAQKTAFYMAQQLGFFVIDMGAQFVGTNVTETALLEVRNGLAFGDLRLGNGPSVRVQDRLSRHLPPYIHQYATTWARTALDPDIAPRLQASAARRTTSSTRFALLNEIRLLNQRNGNPGGW